MGCREPGCDCHRLRTGGGNKYHAVQIAGYGSKAEASRGAQLRLWAAVGVIDNLREHVVFDVHPDGCARITLNVDFAYTEDGVTVLEDHKGGATRGGRFPVCWALLRWRYPEAILRISYMERGRINWHDDPPKVLPQKKE